MDFFARQDRARAQTGQLLGLFALAVTVVVAVITTVLVLIVSSAARNSDVALGSAEWWFANRDPIALCAAGVLFVVLAGTAFRLLTLQGGGAVVARSMGGDLVDTSTKDPLQQRLLNVVEEMAMASGVPVPAVYVLNREAGINAFAAGHTPADSVVTVTRGALEQLDRAELQGVVAHEFSHILNGDMRLNMRLLGCVAGLFALATVGRILMRARGRRAGGIVLAGFAVFALGWIGVLLGRMIQAAISRQREFLADASAVQFTRDPDGLKQALIKIGAAGVGSRLVSHETGDVAHMLFASGLDGVFATHPPLVERIRALDPSFTPDVIERERQRLVREPRIAPAAGAAPSLPPTLSRLVARPGLEHLEFTGQLRDALPLPLLADAGDPERAAQALWALLLSRDETARARELEELASAYPPELLAGVRERQALLATLPEALRMPLLLRLFPALGRRPIQERQRMLELVDQVVGADGSISVSEYAFARLARQHLAEQVSPPGPVPRLPADQLERELQTVFSVLARAGNADREAAARAFNRGMAHILGATTARYDPPADWVPAMDRALARLDQVRLNEKGRLVDGLAECVAQDGRVEVAEAELLRAICGTLHCPLPPLLSAGAQVSPPV
jgi:Zn-dependent protease with chaperone function